MVAVINWARKLVDWECFRERGQGIWLGLEMIMAVEMVLVFCPYFCHNMSPKTKFTALSSLCITVTLFVFLEQHNIGFEQRKVLCVMPSTFLFQGLNSAIFSS